MVTVIELWRKDPLHRRCLHAHREKQGGAGVPRVMHAKLRHVRDLAQAMEHPIDIAGLDEAADSGREDQAGVAPLRAGGEPFFELPFAVSPQDGHQRSRDRQHCDRRVRFHVVQFELTVDPV